jgi:hypothetical protein
LFATFEFLTLISGIPSFFQELYTVTDGRKTLISVHIVTGILTVKTSANGNINLGKTAALHMLFFQ